jgi:hypothetical protein
MVVQARKRIGVKRLSRKTHYVGMHAALLM